MIDDLTEEDLDPLDRLAEEFLDRLRRGDRPCVDEFAARYPERAGQVRDLLSALVLVEGLKPRAGPTAGRDGRAGPSSTGPGLERVGEFRILREVGRGGMGVVYEAEQESLGRRVALKVLAPWGAHSPEQVERFLREARSAARLHHTNIVPVFAVGEHDSLRFYAMQFIDGLGLDKVLDEVKRLRESPTAADRDDAPTRTASTLAVATSVARSLAPASPSREAADTPDAAGAGAAVVPGRPSIASATDSDRRYARGVARIGLQVAEALAYAHQQGTLHRDIKPSNLLLDGHGNAWVTDFGLAKAAEDVDLTRPGDLIGTLRYMAPERFRGRCDARSDVYALGLTLYEMLTLRPAFDANDRDRLIDQVTRSEPPRLGELDPGVPRDLGTIVHKAIEREPADRYPSADLLADDLRRWLGHEPIRARPSKPWERLVKWSRRNPTLAALIAVSTLSTAAIVVALAVGYVQVARSLHRERRLSYFQRIALAGRAWLDNDVGRAEALLKDAPAESRGWEWGYLKSLCHADLVTVRAHPGLEPNAVAFSPDGTLLATAGPSGAIALRDPASGRAVRRLGGHVRGVYALAFGPGGTRLASAGGDGTVRVWDVTAGSEILPRPARHAGAVLSVAFSPDGTKLASASGDFWGEIVGGTRPGAGGLSIWDLDAGREAIALRGHVGTVHRVAFSPDGTRLASAGGDGTVRTWDVADGAGAQLRTFKGHDDAVMGVAFSPDGGRIASAGLDGAIRIWDAADGTTLLHLRDTDDRFFHVAFSPDGTKLASADRDWTVTLRDAASGRKALTFRGHTREVVDVAFSPDGDRIASADYGGLVKVWDARRDQEALVLRGHAGAVGRVAFSPDGRRLATASDAGGPGLRVWDVADGRPAPSIAGDDAPHASLVYSPDGAWLAAGRVRTGVVTIRDASSGRPARTLQAHDGTTNAIAFSPDGRRIATGGSDRTVATWEVATGRLLWRTDPHGRPITGLTFSPDGRSLVASTGDVTAIEAPGEVAIRDAATGRLVRSLAGHRGGVSDLAYSPDGRRLATSSWDRTVAVWDPSDGRRVRSFAVRGLIVWAVAFSPDGTRLVAADNVSRVDFWDTESGLEVLTLRGHMDRIYDLAFSPDGTRLASAGRDATAKVFDASLPGRAPAPP